MGFFSQRRRVAVVLAAAAALALSGCSAPVLSSMGDGWASLEARLPTDAGSGLKHDGTLTVGIPAASTAPLVMVRATSVSGLDIELGAALADALGVQVRFVRVSSVADGLASECDVVMGVADEQAEGAEIVGPYASSALAFFARDAASDGDEVVSAADLAGATIAMQAGSAAQAALAVSGIEAQVSALPTLNEAFDALEAGEADYVLCHAMSGAYLAGLRGDLAFVGTLSKPVATSLAVAPEAAEAVRGAFDAIGSNGVLAETRRHWLGDLPELTDASQVRDLPEAAAAVETGENVDVAAYEAEYAWGSEKNGTHAGQNAITNIVDTQTTSNTAQNTVADAYNPYTANPYNQGNGYNTTDTAATTAAPTVSETTSVAEPVVETTPETVAVTEPVVAEPVATEPVAAEPVATEAPAGTTVE